MRTTSGKRAVASFPARELSDTVPPSTTASARMPSHFISKAQWPSSGGNAFDGVASIGRRSWGTGAMGRGYKPRRVEQAVRPCGRFDRPRYRTTSVGVIAPRVETPMNGASRNTAEKDSGREIRSGADWTVVDAGYGDIRYETSDGIAKITICRPEVRNAFRPKTLFELLDAFERARSDQEIGVIVLTGEGPDAFCSGGDQRIRGDDGYYGDDGIGRLNVLDLQILIRRVPKPVIAMVAGYAIGGGHVLHVVCDLTIAADNARFGQTGPRVGSFDGGYGSGLLARSVGQKKAREIWFLCRQYDAQQALDMGLVNTVVPLEELEEETVAWCRQMLEHSPLALRMIKASCNAADDGLAGIQQLAGDATLLYYLSEEAQEGKRAYLEKRTPDFGQYPKRP